MAWLLRGTSQISLSAQGKENISQGLKPALWQVLNVWAEAQTYLRGKNKSKDRIKNDSKLRGNDNSKLRIRNNIKLRIKNNSKSQKQQQGQIRSKSDTERD